MKKSIIITTAFMLLMIAGCGAKKTIDVNDYLTTYVSGYDGTGSAVADVDYERLVADYAKASGIKADSDQYFGLEVAIESYVEAECDGYNLSNGDKYAVTWNIPNNIVETNKVILKYEPKTFTVSGLKDKPAPFTDLNELTAADFDKVKEAVSERPDEISDKIKHIYTVMSGWEDLVDGKLLEPVLNVAYSPSDKDTIDIYVFYRCHASAREPKVYAGEDDFGNRVVLADSNGFDFLVPVRVADVFKDENGRLDLSEFYSNNIDIKFYKRRYESTEAVTFGLCVQVPEGTPLSDIYECKDRLFTDIEKGVFGDDAEYAKAILDGYVSKGYGTYRIIE